MKTGTCKLCNQVGKLVRAHIIPRSFFLKAKGSSKQLLEARTHDKKIVQDWQNGVWDDEILCPRCEERLGSWDQYGFELFGKPPGNDAFPRNDSEWQAFVLKDVDYSRLKLFVLSVVWRASACSEPFFEKIRLGKYEPIIADMIRNQNPGGFDTFPLVVARLVGPGPRNATFAPYRQRSPEGINFVILFLPSIKIMVKVDNRPLPSILGPVVLKREAENILVPMALHRNEIQTLGRASESFRKWWSNRERM